MFEKGNRSHSMNRLSMLAVKKPFLLSQNKGQIKAKQDSKINSNGKSPAYV